MLTNTAPTKNPTMSCNIAAFAGFAWYIFVLLLTTCKETRDKMSAIEFATQTSGRQRTRDGLDYKNQFDSLLTLIERDETRNTTARRYKNNARTRASTRDGEQQKREKKNASRVAQRVLFSLSSHHLYFSTQSVVSLSLSLSLSLWWVEKSRASLFCAEKNEAKKEQKRAKFFAIKNLHFFFLFSH